MWSKTFPTKTIGIPGSFSRAVIRLIWFYSILFCSTSVECSFEGYRTYEIETHFPQSWNCSIFNSFCSIVSPTWFCRHHFWCQSILARSPSSAELKNDFWNSTFINKRKSRIRLPAYIHTQLLVPFFSTDELPVHPIASETEEIKYFIW